MVRAAYLFVVAYLSFFLPSMVFSSLRDDSNVPSLNLLKGDFKESTHIRNSTYKLEMSDLLDSMQQDILPHTIALEMELHTDKSNYESMQLVFAVSMEKALAYDASLMSFQADFIDYDGFNLRKKYFRIELDDQFLQIARTDNRPIYLSIFQNNPAVKNITFSLSLIQSDEYVCPFACVGQGKCSKDNVCNCVEGYLDSDCSRYALNLNNYRKKNTQQQLNSLYPLPFKVSLSNYAKSIFFYQELTQEFQKEQKLYLTIQPTKTPISLIIFFSVTNNSTSQPHASLASYQHEVSFLNASDSIQIYLGDVDSSSFSSNGEAVQYTIGFLVDHEMISNIELNIQIDSIDKKNVSAVENFIRVHFLVIILACVLITLFLGLIAIMRYVKKRTQVFDIALKKMDAKRLKKQQEQQIILDLLPVIKFSGELKQQLKAQEQNGSDESEEPMCSVCLCEFEEGEDLRRTYCPHYFHAECLQSWLKKQKNCPHCRNSLTPRSLSVNSGDEKSKVEVVQKIPISNNKQYMLQIDEPMIDSGFNNGNGECLNSLNKENTPNDFMKNSTQLLRSGSFTTELSRRYENTPIGKTLLKQEDESQLQTSSRSMKVSQFRESLQKVQGRIIDFASEVDSPQIIVRSFSDNEDNQKKDDRSSHFSMSDFIKEGQDQGAKQEECFEMMSSTIPFELLEGLGKKRKGDINDKLA